MVTFFASIRRLASERVRRRRRLLNALRKSSMAVNSKRKKQVHGLHLCRGGPVSFDCWTKAKKKKVDTACDDDDVGELSCHKMYVCRGSTVTGTSTRQVHGEGKTIELERGKMNNRRYRTRYCISHHNNNNIIIWMVAVYGLQIVDWLGRCCYVMVCFSLWVNELGGYNQQKENVPESVNWMKRRRREPRFGLICLSCCRYHYINSNTQVTRWHTLLLLLSNCHPYGHYLLSWGWTTLWWRLCHIFEKCLHTQVIMGRS